MNRRGAMENFGRSAPDHHQAADVVGLAELRDVVHQHFRLVHLRCLGLLTLGPLMRRTYSGSNTAFIGSNGGERFLQLVEQRAFQHLGVDGGFVGGVFVNVPAAEDQIVQIRPAARNP